MSSPFLIHVEVDMFARCRGSCVRLALGHAYAVNDSSLVAGAAAVR